MQNRIDHHVSVTDEERWTILEALFLYQYKLWQGINETEDEKRRKKWQEDENRVQTLIKRFYII